MSERRAARPALILRVPGAPEFLGLVRDVTRRMAEVSGFGPAEAEGVSEAVAEAAAPVVEGRHAGTEDRVLELRYSDSGVDLRIEVLDGGARGPRRPPAGHSRSSLAETGGRGLRGAPLMEKIMDSVTFRRVSHGSVCSMRKRKPGMDGEPS